MSMPFTGHSDITHVFSGETGYTRIFSELLMFRSTLRGTRVFPDNVRSRAMRDCALSGTRPRKFIFQLEGSEGTSLHWRIRRDKGWGG
jgi:hypothetical protein